MQTLLVSCFFVAFCFSIVSPAPTYFSIGENTNEVDQDRLISSIQSIIKNNVNSDRLSSIIFVWKFNDQIKAKHGHKSAHGLKEKNSRRKRIPETFVIGKQRELRKQYVLSQILRGITSHLAVKSTTKNSQQ